MSKRADWDFGDLDGYLRQGEPDQAERADRYLHLDWTDWHAATQETSDTTQETTQETRSSTQEAPDSTRDLILKMLRANPKLTALQLADELGISFDGVRYHLAKLRKEGTICHEGPRKGGCWVVRD